MENHEVAENSSWLGEEWQKWSESLGIEIDPETHRLSAITLEGRRLVYPFFLNGIPAIGYFNEKNEFIATYAPSLNPNLITRLPNQPCKATWNFQPKKRE